MAAQHATAEKVSTALQLQRSGRLDEAKELYCEVLASEPTNADAWHLLGMTLYSASAFPNALECLQTAQALLGDHPELLSNLSLVYRAMGDFERAKDALERVITSNSDDVSARNNLGVLLLENEFVQQAEEQFLQCLKIDSASQQAQMNLANCWLKQNRLKDAEQLYRDIHQRDRGNWVVLGNLGECLRRQCKWEESLRVLDQVVSQQPTDLVTRLTHARTLAKVGRFQEAYDHLSHLSNENPGFSKAHHYLGTVSLTLGDVATAETQIKHALEIDPEDAHAFCSLGMVYIESEQRQLAADCFTKALELDPTLSESHSCLLYFMCGDPSVTPEQLFEEHLRWARIHCPFQPIQQHGNLKNPSRRLRIGYASGDFRDHPAALFFEPLLRLCDSKNFETFCYSESGIRDGRHSKPEIDE